jgi:hypothetical protein
MMAELIGEINERVAALTPDQQRQVLDYIRELVEGPRPMSGEEWLEGIPLISQEFANDLREALAECRRVDPRGW